MFGRTYSLPIARAFKKKYKLRGEGKKRKKRICLGGVGKFQGIKVSMKIVKRSSRLFTSTSPLQPEYW